MPYGFDDAAGGNGSPLVQLWRRWSELEEEWMRLELQAQPAQSDPCGPSESGTPEKIEAEARQDALLRASEQIKTQMLAAEIGTYADLAAAFDVFLETEVRLEYFAADRRMLGRLVAALKTLAPAVPIGALRRQAALQWIAAGAPDEGAA